MNNKILYKGECLSRSRSVVLSAQRVLVNEYRSIMLPSTNSALFPIFISHSRGADQIPLVDIYLFSLLPILLFILSLLHVPFYTRSPCYTSPHFSRLHSPVRRCQRMRVCAHIPGVRNGDSQIENPLCSIGLSRLLHLPPPSPPPPQLLSFYRTVHSIVGYKRSSYADSM